MKQSKFYPALQFSFFRIIFGIYLIQHFTFLIPYGAEIYSNMGLLPEAEANPTYGIFPGIFWISDSPEFVNLVLYFALALSLLFTLGFRRRLAAIILWYIWASLFNRNVLTNNPSLSYVALLLVLTALIPEREPFALRNNKDKGPWSFPAGVYLLAWGLMAIGYSFSGIVKLDSPSWTNGTAFLHLLNNPLARPGVFRDIALLLPESIIKVLTWGALSAEILFLPLSLLRSTRFIAWLTMIGMHLGILLVVDFADLTLGMMMLHLFTFDPLWLLKKKDSLRRIIFFDGECGFCLDSVRTVIELDYYSKISFAALQGETAKKFLPENLKSLNNLNTVAYLRIQAENIPSEISNSNKQIFTQSDAILNIMYDLGGIWRILSILKIIPRSIRDATYRLVANNRKLISNKFQCKIPSSDDLKRFLP